MPFFFVLRHRRRGVLGLGIFLSAAATVVCVPARVGAQAPVGVLVPTRQVQVSSGAAGAFVPARTPQPIVAGQAVRTLKRSLAEITFKDKSVLRINERTDLIVQDTASLRNIQLKAGVVWIRVAKGVNTQIETPSATAVARGTVFVVAVLPNGTTQLTVLEGRVDITSGPKTVSVGVGQTVTGTPAAGGAGGTLTFPDAASVIPAAQLPVELGGSATGWWQELVDSGGVSVTAGTSVSLNLRTSPLTEAIQQQAYEERGITRQNVGNYVASPFLLTDPGQKTQLIAIAQQNVLTAIRESGLTIAQYQAQNGGASLASVGITAADQQFLQSVGITSVGQVVQAATVNGASLNVVFDTRGVYRPGALDLTNAASFETRILDRTDTSLTLLGIGAAAGLLADAGQKNLSVSTPLFQGSLFGFSTDPALAGGRAGIVGRVGKTRYRLEGNLLRILSGNNQKTYSKLDSVFVVEHPLGEAVTLFAGRRRFYEGPAFQNQNLSQLIADRYSSAGATVKLQNARVEAAYLYDANPDIKGAQNGAMASASVNAGGGVFGVHALKVPKTGDGNGLTASLSYPLVKNSLDGYAEAGRGPDKATLQTYGLYFPSLFQKSEVDLFVEYSSHEGIGHSVSLIASKDVVQNLNVRAYADLRDSGRDTKAGVAAILRFGSR